MTEPIVDYARAQREERARAYRARRNRARLLGHLVWLGSTGLLLLALTVLHALAR